MVDRRHTRGCALRWLGLIATWSAVGVLAGLARPGSAGMTTSEAVLASWASWIVWVAITPVLMALARRASHRPAAVTAALHALAAAAVAALHALWSAVAAMVVSPGHHGDASPAALAETFLAALLLPDLLAYGAVVATALAIEYRARCRAAGAEAERLEAEVSRAELEALKMQLHPHFLFNTLHAVGVLVRKKDTRGALRMLIGLSDLLRITLDSSSKQVVPLRQELDFLERYLRVEQVRFGDRLEVDKRIDRDVLGAMVPNLALQPLLENAIRHGIAPRGAPGTISLTARRTGSKRLRLEVADDGIGLAEDSAELSGMGLANVRARLHQLYGDEHHFEISDREDRPGVVAIIEIPLRFEGEANAHD